MGVNDRIASLEIERRLRLGRVDADLRRRALEKLTRLERDLVQDLERRRLWSSKAAVRRRQLESMLAEARVKIREIYSEIWAEQKAELREIGQSEARWVPESINRVVGVDLARGVVPNSVLNVDLTEILVTRAPGRGASRIREWWLNQARGTATRFVQEMEVGYIRGDTLPEMADRIRGRRLPGAPRGAPRFGGVLPTSRHNAESLAISAVGAISNNARTRAFEANDDILRGWGWLSTLDTKTTLICISRDGAAWNFQGEPLPESPIQIPEPIGEPPAHLRCRSVRYAIMKSAAEMFEGLSEGQRVAFDNLSKGMRSSLDGQVPNRMKYPEVFKTWSETRQIQAIGRGRWQRWKDGSLDLRKTVDQRGRELTIRELDALAA